MKNIIIAIFLFSGICVSAQTKIWEKKILTSKNIRYLAISQNGKTICVIIGGQGNDDIGRGQSSYYTDADVLISRTDTVSKPRNFKFKGGSNPTISLNGDTVYCIGFLNGNNKSLCAIPVDGDTIFTRRIISNGSDTQGKSFLCILPEVDKFLYSYAVYHSGGAEVSFDGVVDFLDRDAKLSNVGYYTDIVVRADVNPNTKKHLTSGRTVVTKDFLRIKSTSTCLVSTSTLKNSFCLPNESPFLGICSDSNYAIIGNGLFHFPTKEYIRTLDFGTNGTFMECSHLYPWYLTAKGNEVNFRRIDNDSAFYTIACAEAVMATKLSEDGKRIAVITDDSLLTVYDISSLISPHPQLHIDFTSDYKSPFKGGEIAFDMTNSYITTPTYSLIWDFGDGDISTTQHPKHTYKFPGIYTVSLTITSSTGEKYTTIKKDYILYEKSIIPDGALWAEKHTLAAGVTAISFALKSNRILAGTSNGSIYTLTPDGQFERFLFERTYVEHYFNKEPKTQLWIRGITINENKSIAYGIGVPNGNSGLLYLLSSSIIDTGYSSFTKGRVAYPLEGNFVKHSETNFYEDNAGKAGIDLSQDSSSILYSNQGHLTYTYTLPYYPFSSYTEEERGGNAGITSSTRSYDICIRPSTRYLAKNPDYIQGAYIGAGQYFYSIRGGLPYLPNSYFVISNRDSILWISDSTYTLISKFPTKGRILRHLPDKYHSVTEDAVWSFADGKKIDSLPLLGISSFEPFPDGVHLLVMFGKSDSAGVFNIKTKTFVHYFRANAVVSSIAISHDGKQVALGDITGVLSMWGVPPLPVQRTIGFEAPRGRNGTKPIPIGDTVQFFNTSVPVNSRCQFLWDFGDGTTSIEQNPNHTYSTEGKYTVTLRYTCPPETGIDSVRGMLVRENYITISNKTTSVTNNQPTFLATIAILPNPIISGEGIIRVNFAQTERYNVSIINTLGQEIPIIENQIGLHGEYRLALLSQGVYSCVVRTARGEVTTLGFIVME